MFGIRGELKCDPTRTGRSVLAGRRPMVCKLPQRTDEATVCAVREHKGRFIVSLHGCSSRDEAQRFLGARLYAAVDDAQLGANEFLDRDLIGSVVLDETNTPLGTVTSVEHFPASDMLVLDKNRIPLIRSFILSVDIKAKRIVARLPEGLFS